MDCQRAHWRAGHKRMCRPPPLRPMGDDKLRGTFVLPAEAPKMIDLGPNEPPRPLPLQAFNELDDFGRASVRLMFSDHAGQEMLHPYMRAYFGEKGDQREGNAELMLNMQWAVVSSSMKNSDDALRLLGPSEAVFDKERFSGEIEALLEEGIITDTGKTYKTTSELVCRVNLPVAS
eukprot:1186921-Prorocentrum_minimum.AAC.4